MHFDLTEEQRALQQGVRDVVRGHFPMEQVRTGFDRDRWRVLADAGVFALRSAPSSGGLGLGVADAVVVFEELGRGLVPGPLVATELAATTVDGARTGERVVGVLDAADEPWLVEHPDAIDDLLILHAKRIDLVDPRTLDLATVTRPLDPLTPLARLATLPDGVLAGETWLARCLHAEGAVLTAAFQLGIALEVTERAVAYARTREQFGQPIGAFQAVKHLCADMLVRAEVARAAVYAAAVHLDVPATGDRDRAVAGAKLLADTAAVTNAKDCIQVHGGMGFTWEVDAHLFLKRATVLASRSGRSGRNARVVAEALAPH